MQFYHYDGLGSTANLTDSSGDQFHSYQYDTWGNLRNDVGTSTNAKTSTQHYVDKETNLYYFGTRYYDPDFRRVSHASSVLGRS